MSYLSLLIIIVSSLISVAFFTILERKFLGYIQIRKGPNKVGLMGVLQPFSDAIKLFSKAIIFSETMNHILSSSSPALIIMMSIIITPFIPFSTMGLTDLNFSVLGFLVISSLSVLLLLLIGWSANSKYSSMGAYRGVAQMISYEVSLFFIILTIIILTNSFSLVMFYKFQVYLPFLIFMFIPLMMWMMSCLAETNRSPFDFAEGESELVSGFNVEYMGGWFALIFLAEYLNMILLSMISTILFWGSLHWFSSWFFLLSLTLLFLWIRGTVPRFRYDLLMYLNWKIFLPVIMPIFLVSSSSMLFSP